jgi:5-methylcytosine-specific restriction endonuclease McrA
MTCSVNECDRPMRTRSMCRRHYKRWLRHGDPLAGASFREHDRSVTCQVQECDRPTHSTGLCKRHYLRWHRHGDPLAGASFREHDRPDTCTVQGCTDPVARQEWCNRHYLRWRRHGDPTAGARLRQRTPPAGCKVDGCTNAHWVRGLCRTHSKRLYSAGRTKVPPAKVRARWAMYGGKCWLCGVDAEATDHVKPRAKGGPDLAANLRPICKTCNSRKKDKWPLVLVTP